MKYRRRQEIIEAFQFGIDDKPDWFIEGASIVVDENTGQQKWLAKCSDQAVVIKPLDYVVKVEKGAFSVFSPTIFENMYEPYDEKESQMIAARGNAKVNVEERKCSAPYTQRAEFNADNKGFKFTTEEERGTPIQYFNSQDELKSCLKEWQHRLFLDDWVIQAEIVDEITDENGDTIQGAIGYNIFVYESSESKILILSSSAFSEMGSELSYPCQEETLVHELLHLIYDWVLDDADTYEKKYLDKCEHRQLNQMAKSLIMAKYNLDYDYFKLEK